MADILKGQFGLARKPDNSHKKEDSVFQEIVNISVKVDPKIGVEIYLIPIELHIHSLHGRVLDKSIELRRKVLLKNLSFECLIAKAKNSTYLDWDRDAAYYLALIDEIRSRK